MCNSATVSLIDGLQERIPLQAEIQALTVQTAVEAAQVLDLPECSEDPRLANYAERGFARSKDAVKPDRRNPKVWNLALALVICVACILHVFI